MKIVAPLLASLILFLCSIASATPPTTLSHFKLSVTQGYRVSFTASNKPRYTTISLPKRYVLDFTHAQPSFTHSQSVFTGFPVENMRIGKKAHHILRLVFDLRVPCKVKTTLIKQNKSQQYHLNIDFTPLKSDRKLVPLAQTVPTPVSKPVTLRDIVVVLDPGHGGRDPGATGPRGTHEKNITLAIGLDVRRDLNKIPGIKVYMTRTKDVYPTLSQRLYLARKVKADVFVSIHADAFKRRSARGATVFALSRGRATSEAARWIAERENKSELLGGVDLADKSYTLRSVLVDLSQTATIDSSLKLGRNVVNNLQKITRLHSDRVEQASLYVLTSPDIPAILVETGFISNPDEELLLNTRSHQLKIANTIAQGIQKYLIDNPIQDTLFTARTFGGKYIVKKSDTLSTIGKKFNVSVTRLTQLNVIKNGILFIGQVIRIPAATE